MRVNKKFIDMGYGLANNFSGLRLRIRSDGLVNTTDMCNINKTKYSFYKNKKSTKKFDDELSFKLKIINPEYITNKTDNTDEWINPYSAIHLAQWISPIFSVKVAVLFAKYISGDLSIIPNIIYYANKVSGKVNNINTVTDDKGYVKMVVTTFDKNKYESEDYSILEKNINELKEKQDNIDMLLQETEGEYQKLNYNFITLKNNLDKTKEIYSKLSKLNSEINVIKILNKEIKK
jgi:hypothetical protein